MSMILSEVLQNCRPLYFIQFCIKYKYINFTWKWELCQKGFAHRSGYYKAQLYNFKIKSCILYKLLFFIQFLLCFWKNESQHIPLCNLCFQWLQFTKNFKSWSFGASFIEPLLKDFQLILKTCIQVQMIRFVYKSAQ